LISGTRNSPALVGRSCHGVFTSVTTCRLDSRCGGRTWHSYPLGSAIEKPQGINQSSRLKANNGQGRRRQIETAMAGHFPGSGKSCASASRLTLPLLAGQMDFSRMKRDECDMMKNAQMVSDEGLTAAARISE